MDQGGAHSLKYTRREEIIGHTSGQLRERDICETHEGNHGSTLEETQITIRREERINIIIINLKLNRKLTLEKKNKTEHDEINPRNSEQWKTGHQANQRKVNNQQIIHLNHNSNDKQAVTT